MQIINFSFPAIHWIIALILLLGGTKFMPYNLMAYTSISDKSHRDSQRMILGRSTQEWFTFLNQVILNKNSVVGGDMPIDTIFLRSPSL